MSDHAWQTILTVTGSPGSTDTIEQCRVCGVVRHIYCYATLERQMSTSRAFFLGESAPVDDECKGLLGMMPELPGIESAVEPLL